MTRALVLLGLLLVSDARAQHTHVVPPPADLTDPAVTAFVATAREATALYRDLDAAIAAGYRLMGPDMPNMGQHWIHPGLAVRRTFDPGQPAVLTYLDLNGAPVLTGVAYTVPVRPGERLPPSPLSGAAWHVHRADLNQEAFGAMTPGPMHEEAPDEAYRLAMLHAWVWLDNPDGLFAADNWALPYVRAGLPVPSAPSVRAARAVSLLSGGVDYFVEAVRHLTGVDSATLDAIRARLEEARHQVATHTAAAEPTLTADLDALWADVWGDVSALLPSDVRPSIAHLAE